MNRRYAEGTSVPVDRSRTEIERVLVKHGASGMIHGTTNGQALIVFEMRDRRIKFIVPMPQPHKNGRDSLRVKAEIRRRYRALLLVLKAKLEAVQSQIVTFDEEFLAHIVINGGDTVGDRMVPQLSEVIVGRMPPLLGAGSS